MPPTVDAPTPYPEGYIVDPLIPRKSTIRLLTSNRPQMPHHIRSLVASYGVMPTPAFVGGSGDADLRAIIDEQTSVLARLIDRI